MRTVSKGVAPNVYTAYGQARHDLADRIGYYCSYCEMGVNNMIEVEHVHPVDNGGNELDWTNFLLSCKYCNTVKKARNLDRVGYLWPDTDNTDLVFEYSEVNVIQPQPLLIPGLIPHAKGVIGLMGLDRIPGGANEPTDADTRYVIRQNAWDAAKKSFNNWKKLPVFEMAQQIGITSLTGNYSIWREIFKNEQMVLDEIDNAYSALGLFKQYQPGTTIRIIRATGQI